MKRSALKPSSKQMAYGGLPAPTKAQVDLFRKLTDQIGCVVCLFYCRHPDGSRVENSVGQIHHLLSGTKRISHWHVIPLCKMHHDAGRPGNPSIHSILGQYGKAEFEETYATEMELVIQCEEWINQNYVTGLLTDEQSPQQNTENSDSDHPDTDAERESDHRDVEEKSVSVCEVQKIDWPVRICVTHYLHRLPDVDNLNAKGGIDGLVKAGVLEDDSAKYVKSVTHDYEKIPRSQTEQTRIVLTEVI